MVHVPRVVIASESSGSGKTSITVGIIGALRRRGLNVQPFKVGPDYIDASYHTAVSGRPSRNLDSWMVSPGGLLGIFENAARNADVAVIEGVMGLFDGASSVDQTGSTAQIAKLLKSPVLLVIDAQGIARSAAALTLGYKLFDSDLRLAGVILNRVGSEKHVKYCKEPIEETTGIPVIGAIPLRKDIILPERHLGLIPTREKIIHDDVISKIIGLVEANVDLDMLLEIARSAEELPRAEKPIRLNKTKEKHVTIGVALDEAFNFYYQDNLDLLEACGAEVKAFSPIHDGEVPSDVDGLYIGGGFPEVFPKQLEANESMRRSIKRVAEDGMPIYAECGGLMYLTDSIIDFDGVESKMVGLLPCMTIMAERLTLNYTLAESVRGSILLGLGEVVRGHEFHHSRIIDIPADAKFAYKMRRGTGIDGAHDGWIEYNALASYMHLHFYYKPEMAESFVKECSKYGRT